MEIKFKNFIESLNKYSERIAIEECKSNAKYTYKELIEDVTRLSVSLLKKNLGQTKIGILAKNSYNWVKAFFAITCVGGVVIPIDINASINEIINICAHGQIIYLFYSELTTDEMKEIKSKSAIKLLNLDFKDDEVGNAQFYNEQDADPDDVAVILYTSGTTSSPKAVALSSRNILSVVYATKEKREPRHWTLLSILPYSHVYALTCELLFSLENGDTLIINDNLASVFANMYKYSPNLMFVVPEFIEKTYKLIISYVKRSKKMLKFYFVKIVSKLLMAIKIDIRRFLFRDILNKLGNVEMLISGGAYLMPKYIDFFNCIGIKLFNGYGMTECSPLISIQNTHEKPNINSVGTAISCCNIKIKKENSSNIGEICVKGDNVMLGYYIQDGMFDKSDVFDENWIKTGDIGWVDKKGFLYLKGRKKNVIILNNGYNVYPEEIESFFRQSNLIDTITVKLDNNVICATITPSPFFYDHYDHEECKKKINEEVQKLNRKISAHMRIMRTEIICEEKNNL
ncbi:MAG: AMP-binding protein [Christensenellaceae bacterium]|jgi:long-chain acyl-CoA synthetase|nr:AMP-binding protein [Christensenellaceae bacterium]